MRHSESALRLTRAAAAVAGMAQPVGRLEGRITAVSGLMVEITGLAHHVAIGDRVSLSARSGPGVAAEIVGFRDGVCQAMTFGAAEGLGPGRPVRAGLPPARGTLAVADGWIGRVIDPLGRPLDGKGTLPAGPAPRPLHEIGRAHV